MAGAVLQGKVNRGFAIAGRVLGRTHDIYRPTTAFNPLAVGNKIGTMLASFDAKPSYNYLIPALSGDFMRYALLDPSIVNVGDYLVGAAGTLFLAAHTDYHPLPCIACDAVVTVYRLTRPDDYGGIDPPEQTADEVAMFSNWPAAVVFGGRAAGANENLPGGAPPPQFEFYLPVIPGVSDPPRIGDVIVDSRGDRFEALWFDSTPIGWRLHARRLIAT